MSLSDLKLTANRENAQHSTGPRTPAGKHRSSLNALRHGLTGQLVVLPEEDMLAYQTHCQEFVEDWQPKGATEKHLVQTLADQQWRLHRAHSRERGVYALGHDRFGGRVSNDDPEIHAVLTSAVVDIEQNAELDRMGRYASRILRDYNSTLKQLQSLQAERKQREQAELLYADDIQKLFDMQNIEWNPAADGFVSSSPEIRTCLRQRYLKRNASIASRVAFDIQKYFAAGGADLSAA